MFVLYIFAFFLYPVAIPLGYFLWLKKSKSRLDDHDFK
jgi:hypothetical protein